MAKNDFQFQSTRSRKDQDPRIKTLAREAAVKIKALTVAHESQIAVVYQEFRHKAAQIQEGSADELHSPSVTPVPQSTVSQQEQ